jgi:hypothetical protein
MKKRILNWIFNRWERVVCVNWFSWLRVESKFGIFWKAENFFASWVTVSFSRRFCTMAWNQYICHTKQLVNWTNRLMNYHYEVIKSVTPCLRLQTSRLEPHLRASYVCLSCLSLDSTKNSNKSKQWSTEIDPSLVIPLCHCRSSLLGVFHVPVIHNINMAAVQICEM